MPATPLQSYSKWVTLRRRADGGPAVAPRETSVAAIEDWLLGEALEQDDLLPLFESLVWRLLAAGLPLDRASLHVGTLHPQLFGFAWNWYRADGFCDEVQVAEAALRSDGYRRNPLAQVIADGTAFQGDLTDPAIRDRYPLMADLAAQGLTEYDVLPLRAGGAYHNAATVATAQTGGFTARQRADLDHVLRLFALHVERHIALRISANVLDTYLGPAAARRVLQGSIKRGAGESIHAVIWVSDLRGFTDLADRLTEQEMILLLNAYFERMAGAVLAQGGEVLKFIGDGLLAVFPYAAFADRAAAAVAALAAAEAALAAVERLNESDELAALADWRPLRSGIALHDGEAFFGNVGAPERLDFTVIGRAVNAASRVESLSKSLGRAILITGPVARLLDRPLEPLGRHALRGLSEPVEIFSPR